MHRIHQPLKLESCTARGRGSGAELIIVEGDSAAGAVINTRDRQRQAVLPMQGKPLNALRATDTRALQFPLFRELVVALGVTPMNRETGEIGDIAGLRFDRVVLLFDPDADGIHCGALMLMYFYRWLRPLLESGAIIMVRPPLFLITANGLVEPIHAYTPAHARRITAELTEQGASEIKQHHHRGLASIAPGLLASACLNPATRRADVMGVADAEAAMAVFGG